jgi:hypothetical protein
MLGITPASLHVVKLDIISHCGFGLLTSLLEMSDSILMEAKDVFVEHYQDISHIRLRREQMLEAQTGRYLLPDLLICAQNRMECFGK